MVRRPIALLVACVLTTLALIAAGSVPTDAANKVTKPAQKPIRNPKYDPSAEKVDLFPAVEAGQITIRLIPNDPMGGNVLIENKTDKPLTVKVPDAVVGVSINSQFGGMGGGMGGMGGGMGGMGGGMGGMGGGQQAMGGGMGGMGGGMGGMGGMGGGGMGGMGGGGFFSVPAEKVVSVPFNSVCLEHGKADPHPGLKYTLIPVSRFSKDRVLYQLLTKIGTGKVDPQTAQAAAWNLSSKMSFQELAEKTDPTVGSAPVFSQEQLLGAQQLLADAAARAADEKDEAITETDKEEPVVESRTRTTKAPKAVRR